MDGEEKKDGEKEKEEDGEKEEKEDSEKGVVYQCTK